MAGCRRREHNELDAENTRPGRSSSVCRLSQLSDQALFRARAASRAVECNHRSPQFRAAGIRRAMRAAKITGVAQAVRPPWPLRGHRANAVEEFSRYARQDGAAPISGTK